MNVGMLWFDNDPRTALTVKVERAADYYRQKYGHIPDLCLVNPGMLAEPLLKAGKVSVRPNRLVLPGHLWIGVEEKN
ncbi:MAG: hypothetical protein KKC71_00185 [Chloroflexi bacterium]|nr:hypothetical protein [Chloroflexota bacterium]